MPFYPFADEDKASLSVIDCQNKTPVEGDPVKFFCLYHILTDNPGNILTMRPSWTKLNGTEDSGNFLIMDYLNDINKDNPEVTTWYRDTVYFNPWHYQESKSYDGEEEQ